MAARVATAVSAAQARTVVALFASLRFPPAYFPHSFPFFTASLTVLNTTL